MAAAVSTAGYLLGGQPNLARVVVGDVVVFAVLGAGGATADGRVRHEAGIWLAVIGAVLAADPRWPPRLWEAGLVGVFAGALAIYLWARRRLCS